MTLAEVRNAYNEAVMLWVFNDGRAIKRKDFKVARVLIDAQAKRIATLEEFVRDCAENEEWHHDDDHNCRKCRAKELMKEAKP